MDIACIQLFLHAAKKKAYPHIARLSAYHAVAGEVADACWENRSKRRIAREKFGVWSRSTAVIDTFWSSVLRGRTRDATTGFDGTDRSKFSVLAYGDGKWAGGRAPHVRIRESAERIFGRSRVKTVWEYNTSQKCNVCGDVVQGVVDRHKNNKKGRACGALDRGLKLCTRSTCSSFLDRDVNVRSHTHTRPERTPHILTHAHAHHTRSHHPTPQAGLNIMKALLAELRGEERPRHLRKDFDTTSSVTTGNPPGHNAQLFARSFRIY